MHNTVALNGVVAATEFSFMRSIEGTTTPQREPPVLHMTLTYPY
jgi:hypothetical protein